MGRFFRQVEITMDRIIPTIPIDAIAMDLQGTTI